MIRDNLNAILSSLPSGVRLVAVSKYRPLSELEQAYECGQRIFAESRPSEFETKVLSLPKDIEWHFIGHLQTNKLRHVLPYVHMIHSVDSLHLLEAIEKWLAARESDGDLRRTDATGRNYVKALLEVHIGAEDTKQGFSPEEILTFDWDSAAEKYPHIEICGLMGMASHTDDIGRIEADFALIERLLSEVRSSHPAIAGRLRELSIGMSDDWPIAVRHGATMVRIGSAIFCR
ncbi:MAG: YggS family pyridoxal phosphate-dependent enzyme [Bacteroidales bacterium]|nr:YggS family pyridoxal phosphate-dependent enzyme [Bacteroidales bacterium]